MFPKTLITSLVFASSGLLATASPTARQEIAIPVKVVNNCAFSTPVWHGQDFLANIASKKTLNTTTDTSGYFYQGVGKDGKSQPDFTKTLRAGISGWDYYFVVKADGDYTVGVTVAPTGRSADALGFCATAGCNPATCKADSAYKFAYPYPPNRYPNPTSVPPSRPLFQCPGANDAAGYTVTFCP
ncbi:hypothetical protein BDV98DRAFT_575048 [Pterulicium gracile]|uniref:Osmotin, thaumatin-like protein n=1 Tax=Pterulicium gracile TaxID=1884261 RepID=A0A5C3QFT6_9AGAR|nr:hypothetical protein BDV98DRAFT_575048 [Pterula gracilis]